MNSHIINKDYPILTHCLSIQIDFKLKPTFFFDCIYANIKSVIIKKTDLCCKSAFFMLSFEWNLTISWRRLKELSKQLKSKCILLSCIGQCIRMSSIIGSCVIDRKAKEYAENVLRYHLNNCFIEEKNHLLLKLLICFLV